MGKYLVSINTVRQIKFITTFSKMVSICIKVSDNDGVVRYMLQKLSNFLKNFLRFPHFGGPFKEGTPRLIFEIVIFDDISILTQYFQIWSDILLLCLFVRQTFCTIMFATIFSRIKKCRIRLFETGHHGNLILSILMV